MSETGRNLIEERLISPAFQSVFENLGVPCEIVLPERTRLHFGEGPPCFTAIIHDPEILTGALSEYALGSAYINGKFDIQGDMLAAMEFKKHITQRSSLLNKVQFVLDLFVRSRLRVNQEAISGHYDFGDDFYLSFIDRRYRIYSQCLFRNEDETLEDAAENKLTQMFEALELQPGMRLLDIGAGWGGTLQYCGSRGVHVTSLTLAQDSFNYVSNLIEEHDIQNCRVILEDFLAHTPDAPYDAVVIFGVIEHIPYYGQFCSRLWECLAPGGRMYLDASAKVAKYDVGDFIRSHIYPGTHSFLCLQELIQELLYSGHAIVSLKEETRDYALTMRHWAQRLDERRDQLVPQWGDTTFRKFHMYLWAGCHGFQCNGMQAYSLVTRRLPNPGPRPGTLKRIYSFVRSLF